MKILNIEQFLEDAQRNQYQPYYACYCFCFNKPLEEFKKSNASYINWINARHKEFATQTKYPDSGKYFYEFMIYLKKYITKNRAGGDTTKKEQPK